MVAAEDQVRIDIRYDRLPAQRRLDAMVGHPELARIVFYTGGFGSGKTYALCMAALKLAILNRGCYGGAISPTYKMQKRAFLPTLKMILRLSGIPFLHRKADGEIWLCWDGDTSRTDEEDLRPGVSVIQLCSAEDPDSIKGPNWAWFVIDEPGLIDKYAFLFALSRLRDMNGACRQGVLAGTPEDMFDNAWLPEMFVDPGSKREGYAFVQASTREAVRAGVVPTDFLEDLIATLPAEMAKAYIDGEFVAFKSGNVYVSFTMRRHTDADVEYSDALPLWVGLDFNVNPMCGVIAQPMRIGGANVLDEIRLARPNPGEIATRTWCQEFKSRYPPESHKAGVVVHGDATGNRLHSNASQTDYDIVLEEFSVYHEFALSVPDANPQEWDRVLAVNNAFEKGRCVIHPRCEWLIKDLVRTPKKEGVNRIDKHKDATLTHMSDALGYLLHRMLPIWTGTDALAQIKTGKARRATAGKQWAEGMVA